MGQQFRINRKIASVPITAGGFITQDLPRQYDYESVMLRINASLNVTVAATSVRAEAPCQLVPRVDLTADGKNLLASAPFWYFCLAQGNRQSIESGGRSTVPPTSTAIATYAVEATGFIDLCTIDGERPKDSNFRTLGLSLLQLRFAFGQPGDPFVGGTVAFSGSPTVDVFTRELVELPDSKGNIPPIPFLRKVSYQELAVPTSNSNQEVRIPAGNLIRSVMLRTEGAVTAGEPTATMLNNSILQSGIDVRWNMTGPQTRQSNAGDFGQLTGGYYIMDMIANGPPPYRLSELWDVRGAAEPKVFVDIVGGASNKMQAVTCEYISLG
jgi:hypothetical protein